jgi:hypothetical protein
MRWMKGFKFSDGYAAGLRRSMNMAIEKLIGLKSQDYQRNHDRDDAEVRKGDTSASMQDGKKFLPGFSIQCNIYLYICHMKLKWWSCSV